MLQPGVSRFTVTSRHPLNGGARLVLTDVAGTRVAHDAGVYPDRWLGGSPVERGPSNRPAGPRGHRRWVRLRHRKSIEKKMSSLPWHR